MKHEADVCRGLKAGAKTHLVKGTDAQQLRNAIPKSKKGLLDWLIATEDGIARFQVERGSHDQSEKAGFRGNVGPR
jgi:hypothetical protein